MSTEFGGAVSLEKPLIQSHPIADFVWAVQEIPNSAQNEIEHIDSYSSWNK